MNETNIEDHSVPTENKTVRGKEFMKYIHSYDDWKKRFPYDLAPTPSIARIQKICNQQCFQACGCWALNRFIFNAADVDASRPLDNPQIRAEDSTNHESIMNVVSNTFAEAFVINEKSVSNIFIREIWPHPKITQKSRNSDK